MMAQWEAFAEALEAGGAFTSQHAAQRWVNEPWLPEGNLRESCAAESWLAAPAEFVDACPIAFCLGSTKVVEDAW
jgi:hypothetical protein